MINMRSFLLLLAGLFLAHADDCGIGAWWREDGQGDPATEAFGACTGVDRWPASASYWGVKCGGVGNMAGKDCVIPDIAERKPGLSPGNGGVMLEFIWESFWSGCEHIGRAGWRPFYRDYQNANGEWRFPKTVKVGYCATEDLWQMTCPGYWLVTRSEQVGTATPKPAGHFRVEESICLPAGAVWDKTWTSSYKKSVTTTWQTGEHASGGAKQSFKLETGEVWKLVAGKADEGTEIHVDAGVDHSNGGSTETDETVSSQTRFPYLNAEKYDRYLHIQYATYTADLKVKLFGKPGCCGDSAYDQTGCDTETQFGDTEVKFNVSYATDTAQFANRICIEKDPSTAVPDGDKRCRTGTEETDKYGRDYFGCYDSRPGIVDANSRGANTADFLKCLGAENKCATKDGQTANCNDRFMWVYNENGGDKAKALAKVREDCPGQCGICTEQMWYLQNSTFRAFLVKRAAALA